MKILVVDDSSTFRTIARKEIEKGGYEVLEAANGELALEVLTSEIVDLITLDIEMPVLNGYETYRKLCSEEFAQTVGVWSKPPPVILVTSHDSLEERRKGFEVGVTDYITKPFLPGELLSSINQILRPESKYKGLTALIAEDSKTVRLILTEILKSKGMNVVQAVDGQEALTICRSNMQNIDLVITDFQMPNVTGLELCKKIRTEMNQKNLPVIVLSGSAERKDVLDLLKVGATDYLNKPFSKEELIARIEVHLNVRMLNQQLNQRVMRLKQLGKLKDEFLSICSHDLRGPLGAIQGLAEFIEEGNLTKEEISSFGKSIKNSSQFLLALVNDLLDLGRIQSENEELEMQPLKISEIVGNSKASLQNLAAMKNLSVAFENNMIAEPSILGNASAMTRIVNNLLTNAIKFTPNDGNIRLILETEQIGKIALIVIDTGIGIPADKIPVLFEKYSKVSRPGTSGEKGTGLGLPIIKELIAKHGGTIEVKSEQGKGSCFKVLFPIKAL